MHREEIEQLLPSVFQRGLRPGSPLVALLDAMEALHEPIEDALGRLDAIFDPRRTPDRFVPFLAAWLDLGRVLPVSTGLSPLRELVAGAAAIAQTKGTARGLILFLETAVGVGGFVIHEEVFGADGRFRPFHVRIVAPPAAWPHRALVERIIETEKPAHLTYDLEFAGAAGGGDEKPPPVTTPRPRSTKRKE
jgi:phage tail-like protein